MTQTEGSAIYSLMQTGAPYKTYKKTILGMVAVTVINPFDNKSEGILLSGDPRRNVPTCMIDVWDEKQDVFFRRMNKVHLETGVLIPFIKPADMEEFSPEPFADATDEDLDKVLSSRFMSFRASINKCTTEAVLERFLQRARELDKSESMIKIINAKLSEVQSGII